MALTGKTISELNYLSAATSNTLFPVQLSGSTYYVPFSGMNGSSGTSGLSALGLPSKVIFTDNSGWTFDEIAGINTKTITFETPFENTNYSADFIWQLADFDATSHSNSFQDNFGSVVYSNKTTSSIDVEFDYASSAVSALTGFNARLVLIAEGESNGSGINGTSGSSGSSGVSPTANYTIYKVLLSYSVAGFTVTQLENTIGDGSNTSPADIQWSNPTNGVLRATKTGAFSSSNILIEVPSITASGSVYLCTGSKSTTNFLSINMYLHDGTQTSTPYFSNLPIEIRIY